MNVRSHSCHDCNCVHSTSSLATGSTRWKAVTLSNAYRRLPFQSLTLSVFVAHRSDVCRYTLAFYRSYSERHVTHTSKCLFRRDPCNKVLDRFRPCSGVDCQPGGCTHDTSLLRKLRSPTDKLKSKLVNSGTPCSLYEGWLYCQRHVHYMLHSNLILFCSVQVVLCP